MASKIRSITQFFLPSPLVERDLWSSRYGFLFTCISMTTNYYSLTRFPYLLCSTGGFFIIQYIIVLLLLGLPMLLAEAAFGQFSSLGPVLSMKRLCPIAVGVGVGMVLVSVINAAYYCTIIIYCLIFTSKCFSFYLPWMSCTNWWNTKENCYKPGDNLSLPFCSEVDNLTQGVECKHWESSNEQFWRRYILQSHILLTDEIATGVNWTVVSPIISIFIISFGIVVTGLSRLKKISPILVNLSLTLLIILCVFSLTLEGAGKGLENCLKFRLETLTEIDVWKEAASHALLSLTIGFGTITTLSSYNYFTHRLYTDVILICIVSLLFPLCCSSLVLCQVGNMWHTLNMTNDVSTLKGIKLMFVTMPQALSIHSLAQMWLILFFLALFLIGLGLHFGLIEVLMAAISDGSTKLKLKRKWVSFTTCGLLTLISSSFITLGEEKVFQFTLHFSVVNIPLTFLLAVFEILILIWIYGSGNFLDDCEYMLGFKMPCMISFCWTFANPFIMLLLFIHTMVDFGYDQFDYLLNYPVWAQLFGWFLATSPLVAIIAFFIINIIQSKKKGESAIAGFEATHSWGPVVPMTYRNYYAWLKIRPEYATLGLKRSRRKRWSDDDYIKRKQAAVRRRLSVVSESIQVAKTSLSDVSLFSGEHHANDEDPDNEISVINHSPPVSCSTLKPSFPIFFDSCS